MSFVSIRAARLGLKIVDATEPLDVTLTEADVKSAVRKNSKSCAFSRACMKMPKVKAAYFFRGTAYLEYKDKMVRYTLPGRVQKEIVSFDRAHIAAPGDYWLSAPSGGQTMVAKIKKNRANAKKKPKKAKKKKNHYTALIRTLHEPAYIATEK